MSGLWSNRNIVKRGNISTDWSRTLRLLKGMSKRLEPLKTGKRLTHSTGRLRSARLLGPLPTSKQTSFATFGRPCFSLAWSTRLRGAYCIALEIVDPDYIFRQPIPTEEERSREEFAAFIIDSIDDILRRIRDAAPEPEESRESSSIEVSLLVGAIVSAEVAQRVLFNMEHPSLPDEEAAVMRFAHVHRLGSRKGVNSFSIEMTSWLLESSYPGQALTGPIASQNALECARGGWGNWRPNGHMDDDIERLLNSLANTSQSQPQNSSGSTATANPSGTADWETVSNCYLRILEDSIDVSDGVLFPLGFSELHSPSGLQERLNASSIPPDERRTIWKAAEILGISYSRLVQILRNWAAVAGQVEQTRLPSEGSLSLQELRHDGLSRALSIEPDIRRLRDRLVMCPMAMPADLPRKKRTLGTETK